MVNLLQHVHRQAESHPLGIKPEEERQLCSAEMQGLLALNTNQKCHNMAWKGYEPWA